MVAGQSQNILALSLLLGLALVTNLAAAPVILFRRTRYIVKCYTICCLQSRHDRVLSRFGNGQFACLILCLTAADLLTTLCGVLGGLILELGDM